jgi:hypothetical protein
MTTQLDKERIAALVREDVKAYDEVMGLDPVFAAGRCLQHATFGIKRLLEAGRKDVLLQAGSMSWPVVDVKDDDGKSPTHFTFQWTDDDCLPTLMMLKDRKHDDPVRLPEIHVWIGLKDSGEVVDFSTYDLPRICESVTGGQVKWRGALPPDFIWSPLLPDRVIYEAIPLACQCAMQLLMAMLESYREKLKLRGAMA